MTRVRLLRAADDHAGPGGLGPDVDIQRRHHGPDLPPAGRPVGGTRHGAVRPARHGHRATDGSAGAGVAKLVDANGGFSPGRAIEVGRLLEAHSVVHFEEPAAARGSMLRTSFVIRRLSDDDENRRPFGKSVNLHGTITRYLLPRLLRRIGAAAVLTFSAPRRRGRSSPRRGVVLTLAAVDRN